MLSTVKTERRFSIDLLAWSCRRMPTSGTFAAECSPSTRGRTPTWRTRWRLTGIWWHLSWAKVCRCVAHRSCAPVCSNSSRNHSHYPNSLRIFNTVQFEFKYNQINNKNKQTNNPCLPPIFVELSVAEAQHFGDYVQIRVEKRVKPEQPYDMVGNL